MKENIFVDTGFSRFASHFSLERTGAMHVALCDSVGSYFRHWCRAFTLAEVLVTLGIIGVVAAITMPTLIDNHQKKVAATRLEKFYSMMSQAVYQWVGDTGFIPGTTYNFPENTKERAPAMIAIDESKTIFVVPKLVFHVCTIARTKDSPGSMTTSASTSR